MDDQHLTVVYEEGGATLKAHISLEVDDVPLPALLEIDTQQVLVADLSSGAADAGTVSIELKAEDVDAERFTKLLAENAVATKSLELWCYRAVWNKLLLLLKVGQPPFSDEVRWPLPKDDNAE